MKELLSSIVLIMVMSGISAEAVTNGMPPEKGLRDMNRNHVSKPFKAMPNKIKMGTDSANSTNSIFNHQIIRKGPEDPHQRHFNNL